MTEQLDNTQKALIVWNHTEDVEISGSEGVSMLVAGIALEHLQVRFQRLIGTVSAHIVHS